MNFRQVHALEKLMFDANPPRHLYADDDEPRPDLHVSLEVAQGVDDGNTYEAKLWTVEGGYRFPDAFYLRGDGKVYVYDSEADESHEVKRVKWDPVQKPGFGWGLVTERAALLST